MASVTSLDAFVESVIGELIDENGGTPQGQPAAHRQPERRLAAHVVLLALRDAEGPKGCKPGMKLRTKAEAREWLRDGGALFSAQFCFEALGMDYDRIRRALEERWAKLDRGEAVPRIKYGREYSGAGKVKVRG